MNIMTVSGGVTVLLGIILAVIGCIQGKKRIVRENTFIPAEGEIVRLDSRSSVKFVKGVPIVVNEYNPVIRYRTENGDDITSEAFAWALKVGECRELAMMYETKTPLTIRYDPLNPKDFVYNSKKGFFVREVIYKFIFAAVLIGLGVFMIWGGTWV